MVGELYTHKSYNRKKSQNCLIMIFGLSSFKVATEWNGNDIIRRGQKSNIALSE